MRVQKEQWIKIVQGILRFIMVCVFLFFILGEILLPADDFSAVGTCQIFEADWVREMPDGTTMPMEVPGECKAERGELLVIKTLLPTEQKDTALCIRSLQQDVWVYVGDELREKYSTIDSQLFGKTSTMNYVFFELTDADAGKELRIELKSDSAYAGSVSEIYEGDKSDIWSYLIKMYAPSAIVAAFMLVLSIVVVCVGFLMKIIYKRQMEIFYLGNVIMIASTWLLVESRLRQFIFPNSTIAMYMGFYMIMLLPYPFAAYVNRVQKRRYRTAYVTIAVFTVVNCVLATTLQVLQIKDFFETMGISHVIIIMLIVWMGLAVLLDVRRGYIREYKEVAIGFVGLMFAGLWEIYLVYANSAHNNGIALCAGLVFLLCMAAMKTGRDLIEVEKEKQMAIAASESKAMFLANMSHEIRTPINTVIGMNEMILRENRDAKIDEYARNIKSASRMLLELINDVLDLSKIEAGKLQIVESAYQPMDMLKDVVLGMGVRAEQKHLEFKQEMDESLPAVLKGDEIRIKQILNNLLSNAIKYTESGSVVLSVKGIWQEAVFSLSMSVTDTGIGIKKEDMDRLFDSFQRLELKKNRYIEGSGLGLNITKQLVDLMNGEIHVSSEPGKGSCFTVLIPQEVLQKEVADAAAIENSEEISRQQQEFLHAPNAKILVVDDNKMNLEVIRVLLERTEIQMDFATGGNECLQMTKEKKYDLILMDHMMPEPDGVQTLKLLRERKGNINQKTEVIVLTANAIEGAKKQYLDYGFSDYLSKPVEADALEKMLAKYLRVEEQEMSEANKVEAKTSEEHMAKAHVTKVPATENPEKDGTNEDSEVCIDRDRGLLYCGGKEELYKQMIQMYHKQGIEYLKELPSYYEAKNWTEYARIAHAIKSTSQTIGLTQFAEKAKKHELAAKAANEEFLLQEWDAFVKEYKEVLAFVEKEI